MRINIARCIWFIGHDWFVNTGPEHMPLGPDEHRAHLDRLAERGQRDES